jgi:hypothetical protein
MCTGHDSPALSHAECVGKPLGSATVEKQPAENAGSSETWKLCGGWVLRGKMDYAGAGKRQEARGKRQEAGGRRQEAGPEFQRHDTMAWVTGWYLGIFFGRKTNVKMRDYRETARVGFFCRDVEKTGRRGWAWYRKVQCH